jgi:hypothetical protein
MYGVPPLDLFIQNCAQNAAKCYNRSGIQGGGRGGMALFRGEKRAGGRPISGERVGGT